MFIKLKVKHIQINFMYIIWQLKAELYHKWWLRQGFIEWNFKVCWFSSFWHFETDAIWCFWIFSEHMRWMTWILACWCILTTPLIFLILEAFWPCETGQIMGFRTYSLERIGGITSYVTCWHTGITFKIDFLFVLGLLIFLSCPHPGYMPIWVAVKQYRT